jgi:putative endonuclease
MCWKSASESWRKKTGKTRPRINAKKRESKQFVMISCSFVRFAAHFMSASGTLTRLTLRALDSFARLLPRKDTSPEHLRTGRSGEEAAYFHLREQGYVIIARNYRSPRSRSELDMVGWDGDMLCFIAVKTRTTRNIMPAEAAVDAEKQRDLSTVAREFLRKIASNPPFRFDVVSVYVEPGLPLDIELFRDAFMIA